MNSDTHNLGRLPYQVQQWTVALAAASLGDAAVGGAGSEGAAWTVLAGPAVEVALLQLPWQQGRAVPGQTPVLEGRGEDRHAAARFPTAT